MTRRDLATLALALTVAAGLLFVAVWMARETFIRHAIIFGPVVTATPVLGQMVRAGLPFSDVESPTLTLYCIANQNAQLLLPLAVQVYPTPTMAPGMAMAPGYSGSGYAP